MGQQTNGKHSFKVLARVNNAFREIILASLPKRVSECANLDETKNLSEREMRRVVEEPKGQTVRTF